MNKGNLAALTVDELIERYSRLSERHGKATEDSNYQSANSSYDELTAVIREIRRRGMQAEESLLALLADPLPWVRHWASSHALSFAPQLAESVLRELATMGGSLGISSRMTLEQWEKGELKPE